MQPTACPEPAEGAQAVGRKWNEKKPQRGRKRSYDTDSRGGGTQPSDISTHESVRRDSPIYSYGFFGGRYLFSIDATTT
jgi:hypothetical protein